MSESQKILFRGKRLDNRKWVYGFFWKDIWGDGESCYILYDGENYPIMPTTRGQYTGLTDKNGVKIFEGDIIAGEGSQAKKDHFVIRWNAASCGFSAGEGKRVWPNLNQATVSAYAVIGNIHDNLELLEGDVER